MLSLNLLVTAVVGFYASSINAADYETYPTIAHTASINGFADKIYDRLPNVLSHVFSKTLVTHHVHTGTQTVFALCQTGVVKVPNVLLKTVKAVMFQLLPA